MTTMQIDAWGNPEGSGYEWGIVHHADIDYVARSGWTEQQARDWLDNLAEQGGDRSKFSLVRRPTRWELVP